ncbi:hypothetical protein [Psychrobacter glacincola]|uniref:hypothetical protein n=1 Tax=Psychrobacter glacincola TaxID=56810 RepID=UPI0019198514|nr:hypothetical protein [Psychrobacter glacincola]
MKAVNSFVIREQLADEPFERILMRRIILGLLLLSHSMFSYANMASPIIDGTNASTAYSSKDIDILSENIDINIAEGFNQADYDVTYEIYSAKEGDRIPFVFEVFDNIDNDADKSFIVEVDGQAVPVLINYDYESHSKSLPAYYDPETDTAVPFNNDAKYFEIHLSEGNHVINVKYSAYPTINRSDWTNQYIYSYSLKPAKTWKSFGDLTVTLKIADESKYLKTNLGEPLSGMIKADSKWFFDHLPQNVLEISYQPQPMPLAKWLINLDSLILLLFLICLLGGAHYGLMYWSRKKSLKRAWMVTWLGILIVPFIVLMIVFYKICLIDWLLGEHASRYHGYTIFIIIFGYPLTLLVYLIIMKLCDSYLKRVFYNPHK